MTEADGLATAADGNAARPFGEYIAEQLAEERQRKTSLEARGLALITTSGAFTTLVLGIAAVAAPDNLSDPARVLLVLALGGFVVAAIFGVLVNKPADYEEPSAEGLSATMETLKDDPELMGHRTVGKSRAAVLGVARVRNETKADQLQTGAWAQIVAMALLALAGILSLTA